MSNGPRSQRRKINTGEIITPDVLNEMGADAQVAAFDGVASSLFSIANGSALVAEAGGFIGRGCHPKLGGSSLVVTIEPGAGFFDRETTGGLDPTTETYLHAPMFVPFQLLTAASVTLGAHHATLGRYDIITMAVAESDDDSDSIRERVAGPGTQQLATRNTRTKWTPTFTATAGTAHASPTVPSTPAGRLLVATVYVPPTSGDVVVTDSRRQVQFGYGLGEPTYPYYAYPAVQSGLGVTPGSGVTVVVAAGYLGSPRRYFESVTLTMTVPGSNSVIHLIYADNTTGAINKINGTPAANPSEPTLPTGATALAYVTIASGAVSIASGDIENITARGPYQGQMDDIPTAFARLTFAAASAGVRSMTIQAVDRSGNEIAQQVDFMITLYASGVLVNEIGSPSVGTSEFVDAVGRKIIRADASGQVVVPVGGASGIIAVTVTPTSYVEAPSPSTTITPSRARYRPGGQSDAFVDLT